MKSVSQLPIPTTFEEFYENYDGFIDGAIEKISKGRINRNSDEAEDVKQQVYLRLIEQKHVEKFDASKGSFSHHIYRVVLHVLSNRWDKNTRTPTADVNAIPVTETQTTDPALQGALVLETFASLLDEDTERRIATKDLLDKFESFLASESEPWGSQVPLKDGTFQQKSLALVFRLMRVGLEHKEIAEELRVTSSSVFGYINKIKALASQFNGNTVCV